MTSGALVAKVSEPYAKALLDASSSKKLVDEVTSDMNSIFQVLNDRTDLTQFLSNPLISGESKKKVLANIFKDQIDEVTFSFLMVLVDKGRISFLGAVVESYLTLANKLASVEVAEVFSAIPLSVEQQERLIKKLEQISGVKTVKLNLSIDTSLLSGFIVKVGTQVIDASLSGQLKQISSHLGTSL